jgi:D-alanine-D-alanine ligase
MRVGLSYDLKDDMYIQQSSPDDALEEYDSLETVDTIKSALEIRGHSVVMLGGGERFLVNIRYQDVDIVFNIAEGRGNYRSREAQIPAILEMLDIPYTGSDPVCLSVCLDKPLTKKLAASEGVITPKWLTVSYESEITQTPWEHFRYPVIIKPGREGSSKGIRLTSLAHDAEQARAEVTRILDCYHQPAMIEEFINGDEVTVGVLGNNRPQIVGIMRVLPKTRIEHFVYSVEVKRDYLNLVDYECPARLPEDVIDGLESASLKVYKTLGCRDFSRIDFRVDRDGTPYFIEINPLPGLGNYSDLIIMGKLMGREHEEIIGSVLDAALERYPQCANV